MNPIPAFLLGGLLFGILGVFLGIYLCEHAEKMNSTHSDDWNNE